MGDELYDEILSTPLTDEQQEVLDDILDCGDEDSAREYELFCRGWNAAGMN